MPVLPDSAYRSWPATPLVDLNQISTFRVQIVWITFRVVSVVEIKPLVLQPLLTLGEPRTELAVLKREGAY